MPYITKERRVGLSERIDEHTKLFSIDENSTLWNDDTFLSNVERVILSVLTLDSGLEGEMSEVVQILSSRKADGQKVGGDINFCICRYLVGITKIHTSPSYEDKIQWIQERLETVRFQLENPAALLGAGIGGILILDSLRKKALGILKCISLELYLRYAVDYEKQKMSENGDIMD